MEISDPQYQKANILIVDDTSSNLRLLSKLLQGEGYAVRCALDGETAITIAEAEWPDIILLDIVMPEMDGYEICQKLKSTEKTQHIPVLFLSNLEDIFDKQRAFDVGGVDYIPKSYHEQEIIIRIENQLTIQSTKAEIVRLNTELEDRVQARTKELEIANQKLKKEIEHRQQAQDALLRQALQDPLTGLASRSAFLARVKRAIADQKNNPQYQYAIFLLECDRFKYVKHNYGYLEANRFLIAVSDKIRHCFADSACISRFEGDDFAILIDSFVDLKDVREIAEKAQKKLQEPFNLQQEAIQVNNCLGIAIGNQKYTETSHLLHDANLAMQVSKEKNKYQIFQQNKHSLFKGYNKKKLDIETELKRAINNQEIVPYYQPIICLTTGKIQELEAVLRWQHPQKGIIHPSSFLNLAEETGLIVPMGYSLILDACQHIVKLQKEHDLQLKLSIELSSVQFQQLDLGKKIAQIIEASGIQGNSLVIEISEKSIQENPQLATKNISELKKMNIGIGVKNFGSNYCSLTYLSLTYLMGFSINRVSIDANLMNLETLTQNNNSKILKKYEIDFSEQLVNLARQIDVPVVIRNIRLKNQIKYFQSLKCQWGQGAIIAKVLDRKSLEELLLWSTF